MRTVFVSVPALVALWSLVAYAATTSHKTADYIASGLGISNSLTEDTFTTVTKNGKVYTATRLPDGKIHVSNTTVPPTANTTLGANPNISAASIAATGLQRSVSVDECWSSWERFWSANASAVRGVSYLTYPYSTWTITGTNVYSGYSAYTTTSVTTIDATSLIINGFFTISTATIDTTSSTIITQSSEPAVTEVYTNNGTWYSTSTVPATGLTEPSCKLPNSVPQCQRQWEAYISTRLVPGPTPPPNCDVDAGFLNNRTIPPCANTYVASVSSYESYITTVTRPYCSQASIGGPICNSVRDNVQHDGNYVFEPTAEPDQYVLFYSAGYIAYMKPQLSDFNTSYYWPTSSTLGVPSCTLGCGRCAVTGGTVELIYWPAKSTSAPNDSSRTGPVTAVSFGTTFTSPTMYISYKNVYAGNACSNVGPTLTNTIVPIPTDMQLSSLYGKTIPCDAHYRPVQEEIMTAAFNVTDMNSPVPFSIYSSQPWCATYMRDHGCQPACPTTAPYKPILVVPEEVLQQMAPEWATCMGDLKGAYDPPIALQPAAAVQGPGSPEPTLSHSVTFVTTSATPASQPTQPATQTSTASAAADSLSPGSSPQHNSSPPGGTTSTVRSATPHSNTSPQGDESSSQNAGGVIASLLGSASSTASAAQAASLPGEAPPQGTTYTTTQNAGGVIASLLGAGAGIPSGSAASMDPAVGSADQGPSATQTVQVSAKATASSLNGDPDDLTATVQTTNDPSADPYYHTEPGNAAQTTGGLGPQSSDPSSYAGGSQSLAPPSDSTANSQEYALTSGSGDLTGVLSSAGPSGQVTVGLGSDFLASAGRTESSSAVYPSNTGSVGAVSGGSPSGSGTAATTSASGAGRSGVVSAIRCIAACALLFAVYP